jgi:hypothetical protein
VDANPIVLGRIVECDLERAVGAAVVDILLHIASISYLLRKEPIPTLIALNFIFGAWEKPAAAETLASTVRCSQLMSVLDFIRIG